MFKKTLMIPLLSLLALNFSVSAIQAKTRDRNEIDPKDTWNMQEIYPDDDAWEKDKEKLKMDIQKVTEFKGSLGESPEALLACLKYNSELGKKFGKLYSYAAMNSDQDTRVAKYNAQKKEISQIGTEYSAMAAYIEPEILEMNIETLDGFIENNEELKDYRMFLMDLQRTKKHTLSEKEEKIIAEAGRMAGSPASIFSTFVNAELPYPEVTLSTGETVTLNQAGYNLHRASAKREDRKLVFDTFWSSMADFKMTIGEKLYANIKKDIFYSKVRNYNNTLESSLDPNNIDKEVYMSLVDNVNNNLSTFHRYLKLKARMLGVDTLFYYDVYAPTVAGVDMNYDLEEAKKLVLKSLKPMGREYIRTVKKAFDERWIDFYPNTGKRSGAYSNGGVVDVHPYILMNYNGKYTDVSTLTHELGHTMHSYFSNKHQPYPTHSYSIFVAEVASTLNEALLMNTMMEEVKDDDVRLSLLMNYLDGVKGTLWRQTQFAEFELKMHLMAEQGKALTGEEFTELYGEIIKRYYGHDDNICRVPEEYFIEWSYIPHFYYNYYVYQYATSFTASTALSERIINKEKGAVDDVMAFLSAGGSKYPIEILRDSGVNMTGPEPFNKTMEAMNRAMDEIEKILDSRG